MGRRGNVPRKSCLFSAFVLGAFVVGCFGAGIRVDYPNPPPFSLPPNMLLSTSSLGVSKLVDLFRVCLSRRPLDGRLLEVSNGPICLPAPLSVLTAVLYYALQ